MDKGKEKRAAIELDPRGSISKNLGQACMNAVAQSIAGYGQILQAVLEVKGVADWEGWRVHITGMEWNEEKQSLRITGLRLEPPA